MLNKHHYLFRIELTTLDWQLELKYLIVSFPLFGQWALVQMTLPPSIIMRWGVRSWVLDPPGACVTYQKEEKHSLLWCKLVHASFPLNQNFGQIGQERSYCTQNLQKNGFMNLKVLVWCSRKGTRLEMHNFFLIFLFDSFCFDEDQKKNLRLNLFIYN